MNKIFQIAEETSTLLPRFMRSIYFFVYQNIDVTSSQMLAITAIEEAKSMRLSDLKNELHVSAPTITGIIDRLVKSGYVSRIPDKKDRRVINITLTKSGLKIAEKFRKNIMNRWMNVLSVLTEAEQQEHIKLLRKISKGFQNENNQ